MLSSRCSVLLVIVGAALAAAGSAGADTRYVKGAGRSLTLRCTPQHETVEVDSARSRITIIGDCEMVIVKGAGNQVFVLRASKTFVAGDHDAVSISATDGLGVSGSDNRIEYVSNLSATARPHVVDRGQRNTLIAK